jgi:virulence-associated protein VapD
LAEQRRYKAINFDLDTKSLRSLFGESGRRKAYTDVGRVLRDKGFEHRQGSGYRSKMTITTAEIVDVVVALYTELPWLPKCVQKLDVTNIGTEYDMDLIAKRQIMDEAPEPQDIEFDIELE